VLLLIDLALLGVILKLHKRTISIPKKVSSRRFLFAERPASPIPDRWRDGCQRSEAESASGVTAGRD